MDPFALLPLIVFFAVFTQTATGFGVALISMPLLVPLFGLSLAAPLVAFVGLLTKVLMLIHYRSEFSLGKVWKLMAASVVGIPFGLLVLENADRGPVEAVLGLVLVGYALYVLAAPSPPRLRGDGWALGLGFVSGVLAGAYNTGGPPLVVYANGQGWPPTVFKANLQAFAMVNGPLVFIGHIAARNYNVDVLTGILLSVPAVVLGVFAGFALDGRLNPVTFRRMVLLLLIVLGLRLLF